VASIARVGPRRAREHVEVAVITADWVVDPISASVAAEEDDHFDRGNLANGRYHVGELLLLAGREVIDRGLHVDSTDGFAIARAR
jgi:hypothetical protein